MRIKGMKLTKPSVLKLRSLTPVFDGLVDGERRREMRKVAAGMALLAAATVSGGIEHTILHGVSVAHVKTWVRSREHSWH